MTERVKSIFSFLFRFVLSVALLAWLFSKIDLKNMWSAIQSADPALITAAWLVFISTNVMILWRWRILMNAVGIKTKRLSSVRWFLIGLFCNLFLPTSVGGDVIKGLGLGREVGHKPKVFASIVLDRLSGFAGLTLVAAAAFLFGREVVQDKSVILAIAAMSAVSLGMVVLLFSHRIFSFACKAFALWPKVRQGLMDLHYDIILLKGHQRQGWESIGISAVAQIVLAVEFYLTAKGMHQSIGMVYFIIFSPIVCVVTSLPSIGGLGVREIGWVYLLSKVGVPQNVALGISLINFGFMVVIGLLGGLFYVTTLPHRRVQYHQAAGLPGGSAA